MELNLMVSMKIAELYPKNIGYLAVKDYTNSKWSSAIIKVPDSGISEQALERGEYAILYSSENYVWETEQAALDEGNSIVQDVLNMIKVMSN